MKLEIWLNGLAIILFLGFSMAALVAFFTIDKQKEITIYSRYGRQTGPLEIVYVNIALLVVAFMLYSHSYRFLPALIAFVMLIMFNGRMESGISPMGIFIGGNRILWEEIAGYRIVNDDISTIQVRIYANKKQYVLRCDKEQRAQIDTYFIEHEISQQEEKHETFD